jgi:NAD(P)-dependent dehydrogenase (short-subunit alcohol dehydrogenase family)
MVAKAEHFKKPDQHPLPGGQKIQARYLMKRPGQSGEVAPSFVFLASEIDSSYITGQSCIRTVVEECSPERLQEE